MDDVIFEIIQLIEQDKFSFTEHALERMDEDMLEEEEVLSAIERGLIFKKQKDQTGGTKWIYSILGTSYTMRDLYIAGKIIRGRLSLFRIITAKEDQG